MSSKFAIENENVLQLLGDFVPQTPYRGSAPGPRLGTSVPQTPHLCSSKISLKKPCISPFSFLLRSGSLDYKGVKGNAV